MKQYIKFYAALISLVFLVLQSNIALAAEDFLLRVDTNQGTSYGSSQAVPNIAKLKQMRFRIPTSNPDNVTVQVVLANPLNNPNDILDSKWNFGTWIYGPSLYCLNDNTCSFIIIVRPNYNQQVRIQVFKKADDKDYVTSDCPATYSVGKNENNDYVISYNLSITCLNIKATFASYTFSGYDIGFTDIPYQYTVPSYVINTDYYELAKQSYDRNGGKEGLNKTAPTAGSTTGGKQVCVSASSGTGYSKKFTLDEQCSDSNQWEFTYCDVHPKAELQVFKNKRWQKVKVVNGVSEGACEDIDQPYEYIQSSPLMGKYRVKHYGDKKFSTAYLNLKVERKDSR
jgi:hypothetical protein